jgi:hypothetical protein
MRKLSPTIQALVSCQAEKRSYDWRGQCTSSARKAIHPNSACYFHSTSGARPPDPVEEVLIGSGLGHEPVQAFSTIVRECIVVALKDRFSGL